MRAVLSNIHWIILALGLLVCIACIVYHFLNLPRAEQIENLKRWLEWACTEAERELKGGTGQLKLRYVYNLCIKNDQFSWVANFISFEQFSILVDEALIWMRAQIQSNSNVKNYVEGIDQGNSITNTEIN